MSRRDDTPTTASERFDASYFARHYEDPETRVTDAEGTFRLARFVTSYLAHLDVEVRTVLDFGCGVGLWRDALASLLPEARYTGVELSAHACRAYGWDAGSVVDFLADDPADLVVCQGVLQYLGDDDADAAISNLARNTGAALYLEALTQRDWDENCSQAITDGAVHLRDERWYRDRLSPHYITCGGGLFVHRDAGVVLFDLERGA